MFFGKKLYRKNGWQWFRYCKKLLQFFFFSSIIVHHSSRSTQAIESTILRLYTSKARSPMNSGGPTNSRSVMIRARRGSWRKRARGRLPCNNFTANWTLNFSRGGSYNCRRDVIPCGNLRGTPPVIFVGLGWVSGKRTSHSNGMKSSREIRSLVGQVYPQNKTHNIAALSCAAGKKPS